jgi:TRAP-type C4-dicarboxylate transport system permease small subunit
MSTLHPILSCLDFGAGQLYHPRAMRARLSWIGAIPHVVITLLMILLIIDMLVGVFLRYVMTWVSATFDLPSIRFFWVEEVGEWALTWMTFIGAALGVRRGIHFAVHLVIDQFPPRLRITVLVGQCLLIVAFGVLVAWFGWQVADLNSQSFSPALVVNLWWLYSSSVVGGILLMVYGLISLADVLGGRGYWGSLAGGGS